jgi:hypothetical protein
MPLFADAPAMIRANLEGLRDGKKVPVITVGRLTDAQLSAINRDRLAAGYAPITPEVVFIGRHIFKRRVVEESYTVDDVIDQIASGMDASAIVVSPSKMAAMENPTPRAD